MTRRPTRPPFRRLLLAALAALACGPGADRHAAEPAAVGPAELPAPVAELSCRPLPPSTEGGEPTDLFPAGEAAFGVIYGGERVVEIRGADPDDVRTVAFDREGPLGVVDAAGGALLGDSLLVLADRPRGRLKLITRAGRDAGTVELGFPPQALAEAGGRLYVSPLVLEAGAGSLLYRVEPDAPERRVRPMALDPVAHDDPGWTALGNLVALAGGRDGTLVLAHRLARARGFRLAPGDPRPRPLPIAVADREASRLGVRPATPFGEEALDRIAVPVVDAAAGPGPGETAYLTRSGRRTDSGRPGKLLVRIDDGGRAGPVHRVPVDARKLVRLPGASLWIVADGEALWGCAEPAAG